MVNSKQKIELLAFSNLSNLLNLFNQYTWEYLEKTPSLIELYFRASLW